ncbi:SRPBCC family protein [Crossiella sp. CA198]|uniref:SRPBCC family protein n=1 Tax=Crossiella sp. CA198 TaxID=3455607 RepID=UPI003F8D442B
MAEPSLTVTTPTDREIGLRREFAAPARLVFAALTEPPLLKRWLGAQGWQLVDCEIDLRVGGRWRFLSRNAEGLEMGHGGVYWEIQPPERLVHTESFDDQWVPGESVVTQDLAESDGRTVLTTTIRYPSTQARDQAVASPMERGLGEGYRRLDIVLDSLVRQGGTP